MGEFNINPVHNVHKKYRQVNFINPYIFTPPVVIPVENTFIGGVASTINTSALLATKLAIDVSRITGFSVVGSDIKCKITGSYSIPSGAFNNDTSLTYYYDNDSLITTINNNGFNGATNFSDFKFNGVTSLASTYAFLYTKNNTIALPNSTSVVSYSLDIGQRPTAFYIPRCTSLGSSSANNSVFSVSVYPDTIVYAHPSLATNNGGGVDGDLASIISGGGTVRYVSSFVAPNNITNLTSAGVYNTGVKLNFTTPSSTNAIDYYECYANGVFKNKISGSGGYIKGLLQNTNYTITVIAVDIYFNKSVVSNSLVLSTSNNTWDILSGLVSNYKLDETSGSIANDYWGIEHLVNTGITINQAGKFGQSYLSSVSSNNLSKTGASVLSGIISMNCWCYRTANPTASNSVIIETGDYANGFGIWIDNSNRVCWFSNTNYNNYASVNYTLPLNTWVMLTVTYDGTNVNLYANSTLIKATALASNTNTANTRRMFNRTDGSSSYIGKIDEASFYNMALTQSNINTLYNAGTGVTL